MQVRTNAKRFPRRKRNVKDAESPRLRNLDAIGEGGETLAGPQRDQNQVEGGEKGHELSWGNEEGYVTHFHSVLTEGLLLQSSQQAVDWFVALPQDSPVSTQHTYEDHLDGMS